MNGKFTRIDVSTDQQLLRGCCDADASPTIFARATLNMNLPGTGGGGSLCLHFTQGVTGLRGVAVFFFAFASCHDKGKPKGPERKKLSRGRSDTDGQAFARPGHGGHGFRLHRTAIANWPRLCGLSATASGRSYRGRRAHESGKVPCLSGLRLVLGRARRPNGYWAVGVFRDP
jgi:hypothetical protein